jgi:hypothetical protein
LLSVEERVYVVGPDYIKTRGDKSGLCGDRLAQEHGFDRQDEFLTAIRRRGSR